MRPFFLAIMAAIATLAAPAVAKTDWTQQVALSPVGAHVLGNPAAETKLVEYVSYTCPHCASYTKAANQPLKSKYVASGKVSVEIRNLVRDPIDLTAALLARCGPKSQFFANHAALMTSQDDWWPRILGAPQTEKQGWYEGPYPTRFRKIATRAGFYPIMAKQGIGRKAADKCLASKAARDTLTAMTSAAREKYDIRGTPSFLLDGKLLNHAHDWKAVDSQLAVRTSMK